VGVLALIQCVEMCIGLTIMIMPPAAAGGGYLMWYSGQQFVLHRSKLAEAPSPSTISFISGITALVGTYSVQCPIVRSIEGGDVAGEKAKEAIQKEFVPPHKQAQPFQPPQTLGEVYQRMGRPILARLGAGSIAFFCAGAIQTYVASKW